MLKFITFLTGIPSVFSGVFIAYNQFLVMQAKIDANEKAIQSLIENSTNLQKSTKDITNVLVTQNGTLNEIKDTVSTISDNTPGIISSNTSTILYFIGIAAFIGIVLYFSLPSNQTFQSLCKNGSLEAGSVLQKQQTEVVKDLVENTGQIINENVYFNALHVENNVLTEIRASKTEQLHVSFVNGEHWFNKLNTKLNECLEALRAINASVNLPESPTPTIESIMTLPTTSVPTTPVPDVANTFQSTYITETLTTTLAEVGSTAAPEIMSTSLSGIISPEVITAVVASMEPSAFYLSSL